MQVARVNQSAVDALLANLADRGGDDRTWRAIYASGEGSPSQEHLLNLINDMFGVLEGEIAGHAVIDLLSSHEDLYENTIAIGVDVPYSEPTVVVLGASPADMPPLLRPRATRSLLVPRTRRPTSPDLRPTEPAQARFPG